MAELKKENIENKEERKKTKKESELIKKARKIKLKTGLKEKEVRVIKWKA